MTWNCKFAAGAAVLGLAVGAAAGANASVLTFDGPICNGGSACSDGATIDQIYGDTAAVDVQYNRDITNGSFTTGAMGSELRWWDTDYNDLVNVAWGGRNDAVGTPMIFLRPLAGFSVTLNGFDLGAFFRAERGSQITLVDGQGATLYSSGPILVGTGDMHNHFNFNITSANGIGVQWGPSGLNVGIDNVSFDASALPDSSAPEPATWAMLILGFGATGSLIRRRRAPAA